LSELGLFKSHNRGVESLGVHVAWLVNQSLLQTVNLAV
jgi:hypothetical protein